MGTGLKMRRDAAEIFVWEKYLFEEIEISTLEEMSWANIAKVADLGLADQVFSVGDEKNITLTYESGTTEDLTLVIMGFHHDDKSDGSGKAGITFGLKNLMAGTHPMNSTSTNSEGFTGSEMYTYLKNTILPSLPPDLQAVIKPVNKKTSAGSKSTTINTDSVKIFLFTEVEIFGSITYSVSGEGTQYPYFATAVNRIKKLSNGVGGADYWWESSPYTNNFVSFCYVNSIGNASINSANNSCGVCFGFCI